jgi:hypothetical protein
MPTDNLQSRQRPSNVAITIFLIIATVLIALPRFPMLWDDSHYYIAMAAGNTAEIVKPFSDRILLPLLAATFSKILHLNLDTAFEILAVAALSVWFLIVVPFWRDFELAPGYLAVFVLLSPIVLIAFETVHIPDMLHMAGIGLFFYTIRRQQIFLSALTICALMTIRESSIALVAVAVIYFLYYRRIAQAMTILVAAIVGMALVAHFARQATNVHDMPGIYYMALKVPANFLHNVFGVSLWTDGFQWCDRPVFSLPIPGFVNLGRIHEVGFCRPEWFQPMLTLASLTAFGILPVILITAFRERGWNGLPHREAWWAIAFWYGSLMTLLCPLSGTAVLRLIGYGWPLFFIALPALYADAGNRFRRVRPWLLMLHVTGLWLPYLILEIDWSRMEAFHLPNFNFNPGASFASAVTCFVANIIAYRIVVARKPAPAVRN